MGKLAVRLRTQRQATPDTVVVRATLTKPTAEPEPILPLLVATETLSLDYLMIFQQDPQGELTSELRVQGG